MSEKVPENILENEQDSRNKTFARIRVAVSSVAYIVMVFIVIYGMSDGVYNGFPKLIPYIIITVFLIMSFVRMYQSIAGDIPEKKKNKNNEKKNKSHKDDIDDETADEDGSDDRQSSPKVE